MESILGSPEDPQKNHFERKIIDANIVQKNIKKGIASAGHADPGQGGIWEDNARQAEIQHSVAHPPDGRADCLRFALPAEATWRLGGSKAKRPRG